MIYMKKTGKAKPLTNRSTADTRPESGLKFFGIIENVRYVEVDNPDTGHPRLEYIVTGRDFGKVFDMNIYFNPMIDNKSISAVLGAKFLTSAKKAFGTTERTPDFVIKKLIDFYIGNKLSINNQGWFLPNSMAGVFSSFSREKFKSRAFIDILNLDRIGLHQCSKGVFSGVKDLMGGVLVSSMPSSGSVWSILQNFQNALLNEMYTELEVKNGKLVPSLVMRQLPFSNKKKDDTNIFKANTGSLTDYVNTGSKTFFVDLPQVEVESADIKQKNVGKSDFERINHIIVTPRALDQSFDPLYISSINTPSIQRHGLRSLQGQTQYVFLKNDKADKNKGAFPVVRNSVSLLQDWFFLGHNFYNGTIVIDGRDSFIGLGQNLHITDAQQLFHIEGYTHTYEVNPNGVVYYSTELSVSRGQAWDGRKATFLDATSKDKPSVSIVTSVLEARAERDL